MVERIRSQHDVIVCGGGTGGAVAALAAARNGANTLLIENFGFLGGTNAAGWTTVFNHFHDVYEEQVIKGIPDEIVQRMKKMGGTAGYNSFIPGTVRRSAAHLDPELMKCCLDDMVIESGVKLLLHTSVVDAVVEGDVIRGVVVQNKSGRQIILGKIIVDSTGDLDVAARAGVPYEIMSKDEISATSSHFSMGGVDMEKVVKYWKEHPEAHVPNEHPWMPEPDPSVYENTPLMSPNNPAGYMQLIKEARLKGEWAGRDRVVFQAGYLANPAKKDQAKDHTTNMHIDPTSADDLTEASLEGRRQIRVLVEFYKRYMPGFENAYLQAIAPYFETRESRRIVGEYVFTEDDALPGMIKEDGILKVCHGLNLHVKEKTIHRFVDKAYDLPYRCLVPKKIDNLLVGGKGSSCTQYGMQCLQGLGIRMGIGQAAGTAAALCVKQGATPRALDAKLLQKTLREQGAVC